MVVLFDEDVLEALRSRLPESFSVVPFRHPDVPQHDVYERPQLGQLYREACAATEVFPDVWVVGRLSGPGGRRRAAHFANSAAAMHRRPVLRDSVRNPGGTVTFRRWVDRLGGAAQRAEMRQAQIYADSVLARGIPKPIPITRPFTRSELEVDPDTLAFYLAKLPDTTFYEIGGCSEVQINYWYAPERLSQLGPGVVPALVQRIADPNPFVRDRVQFALLLATQNALVLARTGGDYLKFYDQPETSPSDIVGAWWTRFGHFWEPEASRR